MKKLALLCLISLICCLCFAVPVLAEPENSEEPDAETVIPVESITIGEKDITLKAGETVTPGLTVLPAEAVNPGLIWTSSDEKVATVSPEGVITAEGIGTAEITVASGEVSASLNITVKFSDVPEGSYYYEDVYWALDNNITAGMSNAEFGSLSSCTRGQFITLLYRLNGEPAVSNGIPFTDVKSGAFYYDAVRWGYNNQLVSGTSATTFSPDAACTRGQIVSFLWRCQRQWPEGKPGFNDVKSGFFYFYPVAWAVENKITAGTSDVTFSPDLPCTRAQIVCFLHRCDASGAALLDKSKWELYYPKAEAVLDSVGRDLKAAFRWSAGLTYYGHGKADMPEVPDNGSEWFADYGFDKHKGNCIVMAGTFWEMAVLLGYDVRQMYGYVPLARGGMGPHSWVEITVDGTSYVCDPDFAYNTGRNGYMIHYGQSGTWRYTDYSPMSR